MQEMFYLPGNIVTNYLTSAFWQYVTNMPSWFTLCAQALSCGETSSRTSTGRSSVSLLDGSYLDLAASRQPRLHRKCGGERPPGPTRGKPSPHPRCAAASSPGTAARRQAAECREPHSQSNRGCLRCRCRSRDSRRQRCERCDDAVLESGCTAASSQRYRDDCDSQQNHLVHGEQNEQINGN